MTYRVRTFGEPALLDSEGRVAPLTAREIATVVLLRLERGDLKQVAHLLPPSERGSVKRRSAKRASTRRATSERKPRGHLYTALSRIRAKLLSHPLPPRQLARWITRLPCDAADLLREEKIVTPAAAEVLLGYDVFLKDFSLGGASSSFGQWVRERTDRLDAAARTLWRSLLPRVKESGNWGQLCRLADHALHLYPEWEEAYHYLVDAALHQPRFKTVAVERGNKLVNVLQQRKTSPALATMDRIHELRKVGAGNHVWLNSSDELHTELVDHGARVSYASPASAKVPQPVDVFLAAAMAALPDEEYHSHRVEVRTIADAIRLLPGCRGVFYAGDARARKDQFTTPKDALHQNLETLERSRLFVMLYPQPLPSSTILEAGFALAMRKPCLLLVHRETQLPFLLREVDQVFSFAKVEQYDTADELMRILHDRIPQLLGWHDGPSGASAP